MTQTLITLALLRRRRDGASRRVLAMTECQCGHDTDEHRDKLGRCDGQCHDPEYGQFSCLCPYFMEEKI